jgi:hypothetical protein
MESDAREECGRKVGRRVLDLQNGHTIMKRRYAISKAVPVCAYLPSNRFLQRECFLFPCIPPPRSHILVYCSFHLACFLPLSPQAISFLVLALYTFLLGSCLILLEMRLTSCFGASYLLGSIRLIELLIIPRITSGDTIE